MKVAKIVEEKIAPLFENLDVRLAEVEYVKKVDGMHLIVYLDKESGVNIEDCEKVAKLIDPILDELNPTQDEPYRFDVSSYGLDRPLKFDWQFDRYLNQKLSVKLYLKVNGYKDFDGILRAYTDKNMTFEIENKTLTFNREQIATILPFIDF